MASLPRIPASFPDAERDAALVLCFLRYADNITHHAVQNDAHQIIIRYDAKSSSTLQIATLCKRGYTRIEDLKQEVAALFDFGKETMSDFVLQQEGTTAEYENSATLASLGLHGVTVMRMTRAYCR